MIPRAKLPTKFGNAMIYWFQQWNKEHCAIVFWEVKNWKEILCRVHSSCMTGDIFHSLKCDCWEQLEISLEMISQNGGVCIYLSQEWRDTWLLNKIQAYALQDTWMDTIESNQALWLPIDSREYDIVKTIIDTLEIDSINIISNNPEKIEKIKNTGVIVLDTTPVIISANKYNEKYLDTKRHKMGHRI